MDKQTMIKKLVEQGLSEVEAQCELAHYDMQAEQAFVECNCEEI